MPKSRPFQRQLYLAFFALLFAAQIVAQVAFFFTLQSGKTKSVEYRLDLNGNRVHDSLLVRFPTRIDSLLKASFERDTVRFTVFNRSGQPIADSRFDPKQIAVTENKPDEIDKAWHYGSGFVVRFDNSENKRIVAFARKIAVPGGEWVVRTSLPAHELDNYISSLFLSSLLVGLLLTLLLAYIAHFLSQKIGSPLDTIRQSAVQYAGGNLQYRIPEFEEPLARTLAQSLNEMARQLERRLHDVENQRNELETLLASMSEGVIAVDAQARLLWVNRAAAELTGIERSLVNGMRIEDTFPNRELQTYIHHVLSGAGIYLEETINLPGKESAILQAHATRLLDSTGAPAGAVIVLNDITRLEKLERIRSEFVANVSHELRTPITSIKGFVETLLEGAIDDKPNAVKFLEILRRQTDRLNSIIQDLLNLSRIEREGRAIQRSQVTLFNMLSGIVQDFHTRASEQGIEIGLNCTKDLQIEINQELMTQAVANLLDNAIKYGGSGKRIDLTAKKSDGEIVLEVRDYGAGIPPEHLERIFERFYRVDTARSRSLGGTGLGLAIVKHIAQAHDGYVSVESELNKGTEFAIHLSTNTP